MQQLTHQRLTQAIVIEGEVIRLQLPLPCSVASTHQWLAHQWLAPQWLAQFSAQIDATIKNQEWGADRYQAQLCCGPYRLLLCIEWLCEAIWLEADAGETHSLDVIVEHIRHVSSQKH